LEWLTGTRRGASNKTAHLAESLPTFARNLYREAESFCQQFEEIFIQGPFVSNGVESTYSAPEMSRHTLLKNCIFDLVSLAYFDEVFSSLQDKEDASVLTVALTYEATGEEATSPTEDQVQDLGTEECRGIRKYWKASKEKWAIQDRVGWLFGREVSAIFSSTAKDIAIIVPAATRSIDVRVRARWAVRYLLNGTPPTADEIRSLTVLLQERAKALEKLTDSLPHPEHRS
jgi:hypothetical protein